MLSGCTTSSDHLYVYPNGCKIEHEIEAAVELGIRFTATRGSMSLGRSKGGLPADSCVEEEGTRSLRTANAPSSDIISGSASAWCTWRWRRAPLQRHRRSDARERRAGPRWTASVCTRTWPRRWTRNASASRSSARGPVDYVESLGWTGDDVRHATCVCPNADEIALFARTGSGVAHRPAPTCGWHRIDACRGDARRWREGRPRRRWLGLNDGNHPAREARQAMLLQRCDGQTGCARRAGGAGDRHAGRRERAGPRRHRRVGSGHGRDFIAYRLAAARLRRRGCTIRWLRWFF